MVTAPFVTVKELAGAYGVTVHTVYRWIKEGAIELSQPAGRRGRYFVAPEELPDDVQRRLKMPRDA